MINKFYKNITKVISHKSIIDFIINIGIKFFSLIIQFISIFLLFKSNAFMTELSYIIVILLLLRSLDFGIQYLRRINAELNICLFSNQLLIIYIFSFLLNICICLYFEMSVPVIFFLCISVPLYHEFYYHANLVQKTFLYNLVQPLAIFICLILYYFEIKLLSIFDTFPSFYPLTYLVLLNVFLLIGLLICRKKIEMRTCKILQLYNSNIIYYALSSLMYNLSLYLSQLLVFDLMSAEDFRNLNIFRRIENVLLSFSHIVSNILWNENNSMISAIDLFFVNLRLYIFIVTFVTSCVYLLNTLYDINLIYLFYAPLALMSVFTYFMSQVLLRRSSNQILFLFSVIEVLISLGAIFYVSSLKDFLYVLLFLQLAKILTYQKTLRRVV